MTAEEAFETMEKALISVDTASPVANQNVTKYGVELIRASDITPEPIQWLWNGWLAAGKFHILGGAPGTGKTTLALALAAVVTKRSRWPDRSFCRGIGNVLIWSGEDDPKDTLVPRLIAAGADLQKVYFIKGTRNEGEEQRSFQPAQDLSLLEHELQSIGGAVLLIVDPIVSAVSGDSHKNAEVRNALQPLVDLGQRFGCAVLGITHFSKGTSGRDPTERITGSLAFGALARVVLVAAKNQREEDGEPSRIFARAKSNIGSDTGGFGYDVEHGALAGHEAIETSWIVWGKERDESTRELLAEAEVVSDRGDRGALEEAMEYLREELASGPLAPLEIKQRAAEAGISEITLRRAKDKLGIKARMINGVRFAWSLHHVAHLDQTSESEQDEQDA